MKSKIIETTVEFSYTSYKPITIELTLETIREVRLFYHIINSLKIGEKLKEGLIYNMDGYSKNFDDFFENDGVIDKIKEELDRQGFEI